MGSSFIWEEEEEEEVKVAENPKIISPRFYLSCQMPVSFLYILKSSKSKWTKDIMEILAQ